MRAVIPVSLRSRRSGAYFHVGIALVSVIPVLSAILIMLSLYTDLLPDAAFLLNGLAFFGVLCFMGGHQLLSRFPRNIVRLQQYLEQMNQEAFPENIHLITSEQDTFVLEEQLNTLMRKMQDKVHALDRALAQTEAMLRTIKAQSSEILDAERQRVMLESIGAACHHIAQPTTLLLMYLARLRDEDPNAFEEHQLEPCMCAVEQISDILDRLRQTSEYRTVPYGSNPDLMEAGKELEGMADIRILDIGSQWDVQPK